MSSPRTNNSKNSTQDQPSEDFKVFVSGLSGHCSEADILRFLKKKVEGVVSVSLPKRSNSGFAFIHMKDEESKRKILEIRNLKFRKRNLTMKQYLGGEQLTKFKKNLNKRRLFVYSIPLKTKDSELKDLFSKYGEVENAYMIRDCRTKKARSYGYVLFRSQEVAEHVASLKKIPFMKKRIKVQMHEVPESQQDQSEIHSPQDRKQQLFTRSGQSKRRSSKEDKKGSKGRKRKNRRRKKKGGSSGSEAEEQSESAEINTARNQRGRAYSERESLEEEIKQAEQKRREENLRENKTAEKKKSEFRRKTFPSVAKSELKFARSNTQNENASQSEAPFDQEEPEIAAGSLIPTIVSKTTKNSKRQQGELFNNKPITNKQHTGSYTKEKTKNQKKIQEEEEQNLDGNSITPAQNKLSRGSQSLQRQEDFHSFRPTSSVYFPMRATALKKWASEVIYRNNVFDEDQRGYYKRFSKFFI